MNRRCIVTNDDGRDMTDDHEPPPESKLTRSKERWAREGKFLTGKITRPEDAAPAAGPASDAGTGRCSISA